MFFINSNQDENSDLDLTLELYQYFIELLNYLITTIFLPHYFLTLSLFLAFIYFFLGFIYNNKTLNLTNLNYIINFLRNTNIFEFFVSSKIRIILNTINFLFFLSFSSFIWLQPISNSLILLPEWFIPFGDYLCVSNTINLDGISLIFCLLSWHIFNKCQQLIRHKPIQKQFYYQTALMVTQFSIYLCFMSNDILLFFVGFELASIPMFWLIISEGSRARKKRAAIYFLVYTLLSSIFLLIPIIYFLSVFQVSDVTLLASVTSDYLTDSQKLFFALCLFIGLGIKIPLVPLHFWLTEAHVEAPTIGSVILAALVLKLGGYGMIKFLFPLFPDVCNEYHIFVQILALISSIYAAWLALRQDDIKRIIAYSSISHMSFGLISMFTMTSIGILSAIGLMVGHGFIAAGLFTMAGVLYDRTRTRLLISLGGISLTMPIFAQLSLIFVLANFGFPLTVNFIGEQFALMSLPQQSITLMVISSLAVVLTVAFSLWLLNRINFGTLSTTFLKNKQSTLFYDLISSERYVLSSLAFYVLFFGIFPNIYLELIRDEVNLLFFFLHN